MMRKMQFAVLAVALCCSALSAQAQESGDEGSAVFVPNSKAREPLAKGSISGYVICLDTHTPARGARVMVVPLGIRGGDSSNQQTEEAATGLDGSFTLQHLPPGEYAVFALAAGYLSSIDGLVFTPDEAKDPNNKAMETEIRKVATIVQIHASEAARAEIELTRGGVLSGKVAYSDGGPASQMEVKLESTEGPSLEAKGRAQINMGVVMRMVLQQRTLRTDDRGYFRIVGISPGFYRLAVVQTSDRGLQEELMAAMGQGEQLGGKLTIYSGNTLHRKEAKTFDVKAGDTVDGIDIVLPLNGLRTVRGLVTGKDGLAVDSAMLDLVDTSDPDIRFHTEVLAGEFRLSSVPEGTYELTVKNGRKYSNALKLGNARADFDQSQIDQMFPPTRAFADATQALIVQNNDLENVNVALVDTKLPESPKQNSGPAVAPK